MSNELYQKTGIAVNRLAQDLLTRKKGDRIPSISEYQEKFGVSRGTVQNSLNYLKERQAVSLVSRGHMGTFIMGRHLKAASGTGGCFLKQQYNIFVFQVVFMNPRTFFRFQITGQIQQIANLTRCKIHQC